MGLDEFCQSCMLPKDNELFEKATEKDGTQNLNYWDDYVGKSV